MGRSKKILFSLIALTPILFTGCGHALDASDAVTTCDSANPPASCTADNSDAFGTGGVASVSFGSNASIANAMTVDSDGNILIAGGNNVTVSGVNEQFVVARLSPDGTLDTTFGLGGEVVIPVGTGGGEARAIAVDSSGRIVVAGVESNGDNKEWVVARLSSAGTLDGSFGSAGISAPLDMSYLNSGDNELKSMAIDPSTGNIFLAGLTTLANKSRSAIARFTTSGILDPSFTFTNANGTTTGYETFSIGSQGDSISKIVFDPSDRIVTFGSMTNGGYFEATIGRLSNSGVADSSFNTASGSSVAGFAIFPGTSDTVATSGAVFTNGDIYSIGTTGAPKTFQIIALSSSGALNTAFGSTGKVSVGFGSVSDLGEDIIINSDESIIVGGASNQGTASALAWNFALAEYTSSGTLESTFGTGGKVLSAIGSSSSAINALCQQTDGTFLAAGYMLSAGVSTMAVADYFSTGTLN